MGLAVVASVDMGLKDKYISGAIVLFDLGAWLAVAMVYDPKLCQHKHEKSLSEMLFPQLQSIQKWYIWFFCQLCPMLSS